jgi:transcription antitermination factor NusA-like protein
LVKAPICNFCAKTGTLCVDCKARFQKGEISEIDIQSSKILAKLEKKYSNLTKSRLSQTILTDKIIIIVGDKKLKGAFEQYPDIPLTLERELGKSIETVTVGSSLRETISGLFHPAEVLGVDQIFVPDGTKELKIRLKGNSSLLPIDQDILKHITEKITDSLVRLEYSAGE